MIYGRVIGTVWATRKDPRIEGLSFRIVERVTLAGEPTGSTVVAVDSVGSGLGETVLVAQGSSARQTEKTRDRAVDAVIMAIVDNLSVDRPGALDGAASSEDGAPASAPGTRQSGGSPS